ncbi:MAG TPA: hypothetical protein VFP18_10730, partial [Candidatus Binatia bacterium]|nr:hypothetical protein [Candidatus Binatia bacterium]
MVYPSSGLRTVAGLALVGALFFLPAVCMAQGSELEALRAAVKDMQQDLQKALSRIEQLEKEKT